MSQLLPVLPCLRPSANAVLHSAELSIKIAAFLHSLPYRNQAEGYNP